MSALSPDQVFTERERKAAADLCLRIWEAFHWERTKQGQDYWHEVARNLKEIAGDQA